jgi:hypothetical protein
MPVALKCAEFSNESTVLKKLPGKHSMITSMAASGKFLVYLA